jgi:hypothetical protein
LRLFKSELLRVNASFEERLHELVEIRDANTADRDLLVSVWQRCVHLEEFASSNKKAALRVSVRRLWLLILLTSEKQDRFDWLVSGAQASLLLQELSLPLFRWDDTELPHVKEWAEQQLLDVHGLPASDISMRRPGDALGWTGFFGGCCVALLAMLIVLLATQGSIYFWRCLFSCLTLLDAISSPLWMPAHRVFRMFLLISLFIILLGLDVFVCKCIFSLLHFFLTFIMQGSIVPVDW